MPAPRSRSSRRSSDGYRRAPGAGPRIRSDVIDVYIFRPAVGGRGKSIELLQLLRSKPPLDQTWQPIMGHVERGETATDTALREMREEVGLEPTNPALRGLWALEQVHPFFIAQIDCIVLSPRFAAEVSRVWRPRLNREHADFRWVPAARASRHFMWPGQLASIRELVGLLRGGGGEPDALARLRIGR
jgi:dihydroneopterin triphosphate diphosphatase